MISNCNKTEAANITNTLPKWKVKVQAGSGEQDTCLQTPDSPGHRLAFLRTDVDT